ncbi:MAG TPA: TrmH family RNA methyltransferase, partial [Acidobacteriaceae bacterium]
HTSPIAVATADLNGPCALMIGNEGAGLSADLLDLADERITIPTPGGIESLNAAVAGSLLLYEAARQRTASSNLEPRT